MILPKIRPEISLHYSGYSPDKGPIWVIYDPLKERHYKIGWTEFECLSNWHLCDSDALINHINNETTIHLSSSDINAFIDFLSKNELTLDVSESIKKQQLPLTNRIKLFVFRILFYKVNIFYPNHFLEKTYPFIRFIFTKYFLYFLLFLFSFSLILMSDMWSKFSYEHILNIGFDYFYIFVFSVFIVKLFHELGHAFFSIHYSVKVKSFGLAFLIFMPVFYTDTSAAWTLADRQKRLLISLGGIIFELGLAIIATFLWLMLDDGLIKNIFFFLSTTTWVISILINLNPFMKFDGYYVLSDLMGIDNLQHLAFDYFKKTIKKYIFNIPVNNTSLPSQNKRFLFFYALFCICYRLIIFVGIAFLFFWLASGLLSVLLFLFMSYLFLGEPVISFFSQILKESDAFRVSAMIKIGLFVLSLILLFFIPISTSITAYAILGYPEKSLYAPFSGEITSHTPCEQNICHSEVPYFIFDSKKLELEIKKTELALDTFLKKLRDEMAYSMEFGYQQSSFQEYHKLKSELDSLNSKYAKRAMQLPTESYIMNINNDLRLGSRVAEGAWLLDYIESSAKQPLIYAYVHEKDLKKVSNSSEAVFYRENGSVESLNAKIVSISKQPSYYLTDKSLLDKHGGFFRSHLDDLGHAKLHTPVFLITLKPQHTNALHLQKKQYGFVKLQTSGQSLYNIMSEHIIHLMTEQNN